MGEALVVGLEEGEEGVDGTDGLGGLEGEVGEGSSRCGCWMGVGYGGGIGDRGGVRVRTVAVSVRTLAAA